MPLRTRIKRALTFGSHDENTLIKTSSKNRACDPNVYQPGEKMPPLKYRRPVAPEHKAHLESFSFAKAWRRRSDCSVGMYSPMGSRMPSRKASRTTIGRKSIGARSVRSVRSASARSMDRKSSRGDGKDCVDSGIGNSLSRDVFGEDDHIREDSDEETTTINVGLSRNPTQDPRDGSNIGRRRSQELPRRSHSMTRGSQPTKPDAPRHDQPFTQEDLELALKRSRLVTHEERSDESGHATPGSKRAMDTSA